MRSLVRSSAAASCAVLLFARSAAGPSIDPRRYLEDVKTLSSDAMKGRGTGTPGLERAARYLADQFAKIGLKPLNGNSYFQPFPVAVDSRLTGRNEFQYSSGETRSSLRLHDDFLPFAFSGSGHVSSTAVFVGYGITAAEYGYDDYAGIDVRGKVAVALRHEPQEYDGDSVFEGRIYTEHSQLFSKAVNAKAHGASAIVYVNDTAAHSSDELEKFVSLVGPADPGLPFVQVSSAVVERWFEASGRRFKAVQEEIDGDLRPRSFPLDGVELDLYVELQQTTRQVANVVGYLPGQTPEHLIVGAHYDHLGFGEQYSLAPEMKGTAHPGADDNASGTAGVLAVARSLAAQPVRRRGVVFIAFAGEELGLLGSSHYVHHPLLPLEAAALMVNMDMIGRIRDNKVVVSGSKGGSGLRELIDEISPRYPFSLDLADKGVYGSSDHTSFMTRQVPVLFFFSGLHSDYHRPSDTWDKIDARSTCRLLELIAEVAARVATQPAKPQFVRWRSTPFQRAGTGEH